MYICDRHRLYYRYPCKFYAKYIRENFFPTNIQSNFIICERVSAGGAARQTSTEARLQLLGYYRYPQRVYNAYAYYLAGCMRELY